VGKDRIIIMGMECEKCGKFKVLYNDSSNTYKCISCGKSYSLANAYILYLRIKKMSEDIEFLLEDVRKRENYEWEMRNRGM
jgi:transposase-like protein